MIYKGDPTHPAIGKPLHRSLRLQRASQMCGDKEREDWLAFYKVLQRDLRSQIIYKENAI